MALIPRPIRFFCEPRNPAYGSRSSLSPAQPAPGFLSLRQNYEATQHEFQTGMTALGFDTIHPQQSAVQEVADSKTEDGKNLYRFVSVDEPRRSGKSESTYGLMLGRLLNRDGYRAALTFATTGTKAQQRFKTDIFDRLETWADATGVVMQTIRSNGHEGIKFGNGSYFMILPPKADAFRSEAYDFVLVDEAGEASKKDTALLLQAILPTMDTRPDAQLIVAGTPATFRDGNLLWDYQKRAIDGRARYGAVFYGVPYDLTIEDVETWELTVPLLEQHHPGVGTLTDLEILHDNYDALGPERFMREYLGQFGLDAATSGIINPAKWAEGELDLDLPDLPSHCAFAFGVSFDQAFSTIAAAWRDENGKAVLALLEYKPGSAWLPEAVNALATKHPRLPIGYDGKPAPNVVEAEKMTQARAKTSLVPQTWLNVQAAAALTVREVHRGNLVHYGQEALTDAALIASRRGEERSFAFGRPNNEVQIVAIETASLALRLYDETPKPQPRKAYFVRV